MSRSTAEWIGKSDDTPAPPRVRLRVFERDRGICQCGCGWPIYAGDKWQTDHTMAIINGGENRETNLRTLLTKHHAAKTAEDLALKSKNYRVRGKHIGAFAPKRKIQSPGFQRAKPQRTASRPIERRT